VQSDLTSLKDVQKRVQSNLRNMQATRAKRQVPTDIQEIHEHLNRGAIVTLPDEKPSSIERS
jgi:cell fate (sporulation/competence/biofilm development) regulator YmcA (YheA/YmcA/DUF963 family)